MARCRLRCNFKVSELLTCRTGTTSHFSYSLQPTPRRSIQERHSAVFLCSMHRTPERPTGRHRSRLWHRLSASSTSPHQSLLLTAHIREQARDGQTLGSSDIRLIRSSNSQSIAHDMGSEVACTSFHLTMCEVLLRRLVWESKECRRLHRDLQVLQYHLHRRDTSDGSTLKRLGTALHYVY